MCVKVVIVTDFACVCVRCVGFCSNSFFLSWFFITTTTSFLCFRKRVAWEVVEESFGAESRTAAAEAAAKVAAKVAEAKAKAG